MIDLNQTQCSHQDTHLNDEECQHYFSQLTKWEIHRKILTRAFKLKNFDETTQLIEFVIQLSKQQDHHPDVQFGYKHCIVEYTTHSASGLSINDFICASHIDAYLKP